MRDGRGGGRREGRGGNTLRGIGGRRGRTTTCSSSSYPLVGENEEPQLFCIRRTGGIDSTLETNGQFIHSFEKEHIEPMDQNSRLGKSSGFQCENGTRQLYWDILIHRMGIFCQKSHYSWIWEICLLSERTIFSHRRGGRKATAYSDCLQASESAK